MPVTKDLSELHAAAERCQGCHLHENATQVVFGAGPPSARLIMVGEQPGDVEDRRGEPFVGPAGGVLDGAEEELILPGEPARMTALIPGSRLVIMPGTGHFAPFEQPQAYVEELRAFFRPYRS